MPYGIYVLLDADALYWLRIGIEYTKEEASKRVSRELRSNHFWATGYVSNFTDTEYPKREIAKCQSLRKS